MRSLNKEAERVRNLPLVVSREFILSLPKETMSGSPFDKLRASGVIQRSPGSVRAPESCAMLSRQRRPQLAGRHGLHPKAQERNSYDRMEKDPRRY